jgi:hypothetical protein
MVSRAYASVLHTSSDTGTLGSNSLVFNEELYKRRSLPLKYSPYICGCLLTHLEFGGAPDRAIGWLSCSVVALLVMVVYEDILSSLVNVSSGRI